MAEPAPLTTLHRAVDELRSCVGDLRSRYGDIPAVKRLAGDVDRIDLDASELDGLPAAAASPAQPMQMIPDEPPDPALWADADDEGVGGYHGGSAQ